MDDDDDGDDDDDDDDLRILVAILRHVSLIHLLECWSRKPG
jgi:hypothetical protein